MVFYFFKNNNKKIEEMAELPLRCIPTDSSELQNLLYFTSFFGLFLFFVVVLVQFVC